MGGRLFPSFSFCLYLVALNVYCSNNAWGDEYESSCLVLQLQSAEHLERRGVPKGGGVGGWVGLGGSKRPLLQRNRVKLNAIVKTVNPLTPNDPYSGRTAPLNSKDCILYI
jgi:hypothetical protein